MTARPSKSTHRAMEAIIMHRINIKKDVAIRDRWLEVPHECDPDCPGEINRRKLAAAEELLEAAKGCHDAIGELASTNGYSAEGPESIGEWLVLEVGNPSWRTLFTELVAAIAAYEGSRQDMG